MKLTIDNKEYELNTTRAIELGVLTETYPKTTHITAGDKFQYKDQSYEVHTLIKLCKGDMYILSGVDGCPFIAYNMDMRNYDDMIVFLNKSGFHKI